MQLIPHDPKYYFTFCTDYDLSVYDIAKAEQEAKNADHKKHKPLETSKWLALSLGENITPMMEFIGYMFYPRYEPIQAFLMLIGKGGDGKTTFANYLSNLLVESNVAHVPIENLTDDKSNNFSLSELYGKWLNIHADISKAFIRNPSALKNLTGNDDINAPVKNKKDMIFKNHAKLLFIGNEEPSFSDTTEGFRRRVFIMTFNRIDDFENKFSMDKIKQERGKFVYTCIYYAKKAMDKGKFTETPSIRIARNKWLSDNDLVQQFLDDNYIQEEGSKISQDNLYQDYREWSDENGTKTLSSIKFKNELERKGIVRNSKNIRKPDQRRQRIYYYIGLAPKNN
jgi:putative DNA primase/helicase